MQSDPKKHSTKQRCLESEPDKLLIGNSIRSRDTSRRLSLLIAVELLDFRRIRHILEARRAVCLDDSTSSPAICSSLPRARAVVTSTCGTSRWDGPRDSARFIAVVIGIETTYRGLRCCRFSDIFFLFKADWKKKSEAKIIPTEKVLKKTLDWIPPGRRRRDA